MTKNKLTLFDLVKTSRELIDTLIETGGELTEDLEAALIENKEALESKAVGYAYTIDSIDKEIEQLKDMEKQIKARSKALESAKERIKKALLSGLISCEVEKIEAPQYKITVGKKRAFVKYNNKELIPEGFYKTSITKSLDKTLVTQKLKAGEEVPGAELIEGEKQLYIK